MGRVPHRFFPGNGGLAGADLEGFDVGGSPGELVFEAAGLGGGQAGQFGLEFGDLPGDPGGFEGGLVGGEFVFLGGAEDACLEEPPVGGAGLVVEPPQVLCRFYAGRELWCEVS